MSTKYLQAINFLISGGLILLGFSCSIIESPAEYGTPSADFRVTGTVTSTETDQAIQHIRVILQTDTVNSKNDTAFTDNEGVYEVIDKYAFPTSQTYKLMFEDIDNEANGSFNDHDTLVEFENPEFTGGNGHWYEGEASIEFNVGLTPKR